MARTPRQRKECAMREYEIASDENMEETDRDPDAKIEIPCAESGEANELHIWYTKDQTIVWGAGDYCGQEYYVTQGRVSPEDCQSDYLEQEAKALTPEEISDLNSRIEMYRNWKRQNQN